MNNLMYTKWFIELNNQEYQGNNKILDANIKQYGNIEGVNQ